MSKATRLTFGVLLTAMLMAVTLLVPSSVRGGIFNSSQEVTYKEYWIDHSEFTGGCNADGSPTNPSGTSYIEPQELNKCPKTLNFTIPDDFSSAIKVEIFVDLWRNYDIQAARFKINNGATTYAPPVGSDWSRSPWVGEIDASDLKQGSNNITFWGARKYQARDVAFRIYYDESNPLVAGEGSDVTPPDGQLTTIEDDNGPVGPNAGGVLEVNDDQLKLTASVDETTQYVEFHAWYEGYDEDNDGVVRDWHNLSRNNWCIGGKEMETNPLGVNSRSCTINHIGTVKPNGGTATITWDLPHITNQAVIKFKLRLIDGAGNVRDAAGGESADFSMTRDGAVLAYIIPGFDDAGLHMDGSKPDSVDYNFDLPDNIESFDQAYLLGNYWKNPKFKINLGNASFANPGDNWTLGVKDFNSSRLEPGRNRLTYEYQGNGTGNFIEFPGPMIVVRETNSTGDSKPPFVSQQNPAPNATNVFFKDNIVAHVSDIDFGVDFTSVEMTVNGENVSNKVKIEGVSSDYTLVYNPTNDLPFDSTVDVTIDACDLAGNCMNKVSYSFKTAGPDNTPPVISNVQVEPRAGGAAVRWNTDEPASSQVDYGTNDNYGLGSVSDETLKTVHELDITGLSPESTYHYQITSIDLQGNKAQTKDATFTTTEPAEILSDDFNACALNTDIWEFTDTVGGATLVMTGTEVEINVPGGVNHDWKNGKIPPRLLQLASDNDFSFEVKIDTNVTQGTQTQGVLVEEDSDTYVRVSYEYTINDTVIMYAEFVDDGTRIKGASRPFDPPPGVPMYIRVERQGDEFRWYFWNGTGWTRASAPFTYPMTVKKVGMFAGNSGISGLEPAHTARFDYFFNSASPIVPEDGIPNALSLTTVGNGVAAKSPDKSDYTCFEEVTILANTTTPGWEFAEWTGDVVSTNATEVVIMDGPKTATATFAAIPYTLTANIVNNGDGGEGNTVVKNPDQETYIYDDVVELTAAPEDGWSFIGWTGSLTGTLPVDTLLMRQNETVTATFEQDQYVLDVTIVNDGIGTGGTVVADPDKPTYVYGETATLTATPEPGWTFTGWSGAGTGTGSQTQVLMTEDTNVIATFVQDQYELTVDITNVGEGEGGTVGLVPDKETYVFGDVVQVTAAVNPGWDFGGWGGALSGNDLTEELTISEDTVIEATFIQERYTLDVTVNGPGSVVRVPDKADYLFGDVVTLSAVPDSGNFFIGWGGALGGAESPTVITIMDDTTVTANFSSNPPPNVDPIADETVDVNENVSFVVTATDPEDEAIELTVEGLPAGATFVDNGDGTGSFSWTPAFYQAGEYDLLFIATDAEGGVGSAAMRITVNGSAYGIALPITIAP